MSGSSLGYRNDRLRRRVTSWVGTVFKVNADGSGFALVRSFAGGVADGEGPYGSLVVSGSSLYGVTYRWAAPSRPRRSVFKVNADGAGYAVVRSFARRRRRWRISRTARWPCRGRPSTE